jgi:hypothetical protein
MKIDIKEPGSSKFYEEYLFLATNYNKVKKSKNKKTSKLILSNIMYSLFGTVFFVLFLLVYLKNGRVVYLISSIIFGLILLVGLFAIFVVLNRIKFLKNNFKKTVFEINKDKVSVDKDFELAWKDIESIVINRNTITFFPKEGTNFICTRIEYKDEIIKELNKLKKDNLIIDNIGE